MQKLETKREINQLSLLFAITYMVSYMTRTNFGAIVSEISESTGFSKSLLALPLTGSFVAYGIGQLLSGALGDKISPKRLVSIGLCITVCMNVLIPLCQSPWMMLAVWSVNGFAQAFLWPPMTRMMAASLTADAYKNTVTTVNCGGSVGTILIYLTAPVVILIVGWRGVFLTSAVLGAIMLAVWHFTARDIFCEEEAVTSRQEKVSVKEILSPMMLFVFLAIVLMGMLREGITAWMPSFISESFGLQNEISILCSVMLPVFAILSMRFSNVLYRKWISNPLTCAGVLFGGGALFAYLLYLCSGQNVVFSVAFSAALTGSVNGVNLMLVCMIPQYFESRGCVSTVSGMLNFFTYVGSALATYGIAVLSETVGWSATIFIWFLAALVGTIICLLCIKPWNKKFA